MRVIIVGAGQTGTQLARYMVQEKHDVSLIESDEETARHASNRIDCLVLHDTGTRIESLEEAGIAKADALICLTESDEKNMIICGLAASRYPGLVKIARVRNAEYTMLMGIDRFVHPDIEAALAVLNVLPHGASGNILRFPGTPYELGSVSVEKGSALDGLSLVNFRPLVQGEALSPWWNAIRNVSSRQVPPPSGQGIVFTSWSGKITWIRSSIWPVEKRLF